MLLVNPSDNMHFFLHISVTYIQQQKLDIIKHNNSTSQETTIVSKKNLYHQITRTKKKEVLFYVDLNKIQLAAKWDVNMPKCKNKTKHKHHQQQQQSCSVFIASAWEWLLPCIRQHIEYDLQRQTKEQLPRWKKMILTYLLTIKYTICTICGNPLLTIRYSIIQTSILPTITESLHQIYGGNAREREE